MKITVSAGNWAERYLDSEPCELILPDGMSVADALEKLPLPSVEIGMTAINDKAVTQETLLSDGDILKIYPVIIGG